MQLLVLIVHCTTVVKCTVVIAGTLRAVGSEDVVTGLEHLTRGGEGGVSLGQIYHELIDLVVGSRCATVEDLLRLVVECHEGVVLRLVVLTDVVTARELLGEFIHVEVGTERFGDHSLEVFLGSELVGGVHQPRVAVVVRALAGIAVERRLGAAEQEVVLAVLVVLLFRFGRNEHDGVVTIHKGEGAQVEILVVGTSRFHVSANALDGFGCVNPVSLGMRPLVGVFGILDSSDLLHFDLPSTIRSGGVEVLVRRICKILVFVHAFALEVEGLTVTRCFKDENVVERQAGRCGELLSGEEAVAVRSFGERRLKHIRLSGYDVGHCTIVDVSTPMASRRTCRSGHQEGGQSKQIANLFH